MAKIAIEKKPYSEAEVFLRHDESNAPSYARIGVDLTNVYRELDQLNDALLSATRVLELAPEMAETHILYAGVLGTNGRHDEAIQAYEKALQIAPDKPGALCGMAHHQKTIGQTAASKLGRPSCRASV